MSNYHVLEQSKDGNTISVILHIPIPTINNDANVSYQTAIVGMQGGSPISSRLTTISVEEQTELNNGTLYEIVGSLDTFPAENTASKISKLDALWRQTRDRIYTELGFKLKYWGFERNVPA